MRLAVPPPSLHRTLTAVLLLWPVSILIETAMAVEMSDSTAAGGQATAQQSIDTADRTLGIAAPSQDCFILGARSFSIPFTVAKTGTRPIEVRLFVRPGNAGEWRVVSHKRPDAAKAEFEFTSSGDGEFWFATRTIDAAGNAHPGSEIQPQLKVYVDTVKPIVELAVDASAEGQVTGSLAIQDTTPTKSVSLRYVTDAVTASQQVAIDPKQTHQQIRFAPNHAWQRMSLQLIAVDSAGNQTVVNRQLQRPRIANAAANRFAINGTEATPMSRPNQSPQSAPGPADSPAVVGMDRSNNELVQFQSNRQPSRPPYVPAGVTGSPLGGYRGGIALPQPETAAHRQMPTTIAGADAAASGSLFAAPQPTVAGDAGSPRHTSLGHHAKPQFDLPPPDDQPTPTPDSAVDGLGLNRPQQTIEKIPAPPADGAKPEQPRPRTVTEAMRPLTEQSAVPKQADDDTPQRRQSRRPTTVQDVARAPIRYSDSVRFSLDYELQAVGNLGVEAIELYGSTDGGQSWDLWGTDPDRVSPFDIETKEAGVFSFCIVVVGRNGLASPRPQRGETPDIVVVVDDKRPDVRITAAQYGEGNRIGSLVIRYECLDTHLGARPISLSFSDGLNGPWTTIAAGLKNDGQYVWPADPNLPRQIYLRIDAKDEAGNVGTFVLEKPIDVQGLAPRARIRGFQSLSGLAAPSSTEQTAQQPTASFK